VKIIRDDQIITGIGLTSDQDMLNWKIKNPKGILYVTVNNKENQSVDTIPKTKPDEKVIPKPEETNEAVKFK